MSHAALTTLTDDEAMFRDAVAGFANEEVRPRVQQMERDGKIDPALIKKFFERTGCPILVNTSFNIRGEPLVCTPEDAFRCFMGTQLDMLAIGNCILEKEGQSPELLADYSDRFELD